jgi:hypothetical protein
MGKSFVFKIIFCLCLLTVVSSCIVPRHIKKTYIGCYDGTPTGIDSILDLSGYYLASSFDESFATRCRFLVFYDDGMVFRGGDWITESYDCNVHIQSEFHHAKTDSKFGWRANEWGLYELKDNTIKVEFVHHPSPPERYASYIVRYIVIDRHTIEEVFSFENDAFYSDSTLKTYHFMPVENLPSSKCWLKSKKWFWCSRDNWKEYKRQLKK